MISRLTFGFTMTKNIGIFVYNEAEVLDFSGPFEVFSTAARVYARQNQGKRLFKPVLIAQDDQPVTARSGFRLLPNATFSDHPKLELLVLPGGNHERVMGNPVVMEWIQSQSRQVKVTASVCTGVFLLAQAGVIKTQRVTTHWEDIAALQRLFPSLEVVEAARWVDSGSVLTSAGVSAGIDMCLYLVSRMGNEALAADTARQMDYHWQKNT